MRCVIFAEPAENPVTAVALLNAPDVVPKLPKNPQLLPPFLKYLRE